ncbi:MAG: ATP-binding protein [Desulforhopalus sp.]|jgi:two-component system sensor histidine kinase PilS (NtrC family)|nr:ATP-binding protein [Desulforhopalus sp.]
MGWTKALNFPSFINRAKATVSVEEMLRSQLLWLLLLRIVLYTLLLAISYLFPAGPLEVSLLPAEIFSLLLLLVFMTTMFSAIFLLVFQGNLRNFGFVQIFLDTLFVSLLVFFSGASSSIFTSAYFFPIVAGGLILPRKGGLLAAAAATLIYGTLLVLESQGLYPIYLDDGMSISAKSSSAVLNHFAVLGLTFFLAAILSALFGSRLQKTENALSDSLKNFNSLAILHKQIFDNITTGIITITEGGQITSANNAVTKITGLQPDDLLGTPLAELFPGIELHTENHRQTTDFIKEDGTHVRIGYAHMLIQRSPDEQTEQHPPHTIITLRDISEIEQLERQVRQTEKLAAIGMMSASIAHDFRNPLTAISGSAQVLANEFSAAGTKDYSNFELAKIILRESNRLIEEISDFLKFSRPEHAKCGWFSLRSCLGEVLQVCRADPEWPKSAQIILDFPETLDIWADENQLFTVLIYLLQNALAFCPKGEERITIAAIESGKVGPGPETVTIAVSDNGPGIEESRREQIFEPFYTTRPEGTGLGLAIVRQTVEEHRGSISVDRGKDGGARFTISLPLPQ